MPDPADPLASEWVPQEHTVYAVVGGPSVESMEQGLLASSDFEVLVPAGSLPSPLREKDAIHFGGINYDIVGVRSHPHVPPAVAYRYMIKRVA